MNYFCKLHILHTTNLLIYCSLQYINFSDWYVAAFPIKYCVSPSSLFDGLNPAFSQVELAPAEGADRVDTGQDVEGTVHQPQ